MNKHILQKHLHNPCLNWCAYDLNQNRIFNWTRNLCLVLGYLGHCLGSQCQDPSTLCSYPQPTTLYLRLQTQRRLHPLPEIKTPDLGGVGPQSLPVSCEESPSCSLRHSSCDQLASPCHPSNRITQSWSLGQYRLLYFASFSCLCNSRVLGLERWEICSDLWVTKATTCWILFVAVISSSLSISSTGVSSTLSSSNTPWSTTYCDQGTFFPPFFAPFMTIAGVGMILSLASVQE